MATVTPRRSTRVRVERVPMLNDSEDDLSELESVVEDDYRSLDSSSGGEGVFTKPRTERRTPKKRAKLSTTSLTKRVDALRKKTPLRKGPRRSFNADSITSAAFLVNDEACKNQIRIIDVVLDLSKKKCDLKQCVENWNRLYTKDSDSAIASVMSFVLHMSGCALPFPTSKINDNLNDPAFIKPFQTSIEEGNASFGLLNPNKTAVKRIESRLKTWISLWIELMPPDVLYESDIIARVIEWSTTLSQNSLRTIRLVSCAFSFAVLDALIVIRQKIQTQLSAIEKSLQQKSKRPAKAILQMEEDKAEFQSNVDTFDLHISAIFQEIFVPRYRDICTAVRGRCIESLRDWILAFDSFASDAYFKYLGWALNSSYSSVRSLAIRAVDTLIKSDSVRPKMTSFLNRFIQRIIEMHNDVDEAIGACAINTCTTLLVHDDILQNFESFGDVAPLLWDKSRVIREAAANYVFEDSFSPEGLESSSKASLQTDIEQLFTIYSEAGPKEGSYPFFVATLVDLFFFKLSCIRDREALVDSLKSSADTRSPSAKGQCSLSHFVAQLMLSCCEYVSANQESHSRLSKSQQATILLVFESFLKFISEPEFFEVLKQFQAEPESFCCLVKLITVVAKKRRDKDDCSNLSLCSGVGSALLALFKRETNPIYLRPAGIALASIAGCDTDLERDLQQVVAEFVQSLQQLEISDYFQEQSSLFALASLNRICCISQQVYCPILQESEFFHETLMDILNSVGDAEPTAVVSSIIENLVKISHSVILWGLLHQLEIDAVQQSVSRLLDAVKVLFSSSFVRLSALAASITADLSVVALNNPQIRFCLNDDIFHLMREYVSSHSNCLQAVNAGARMVCAFCPEHISIGAILLCSSVDPDLDESSHQVVKAVVAYLRSRNGKVLASAILEALLSLFKDKGIQGAYSLSRRMAMSYGVSGTAASHFDAIIIGGIDRFIDGEVDASFLSALHPFVHRSSPSMLKSASSHIQSIVQAHTNESMFRELDSFNKLLAKKLPPGSATSVRAQDNGNDGIESIQGIPDHDQQEFGEHDATHSVLSG